MKKIICFLVAVLMAIGVVSGSGILSERAMAVDGCSETFLGLKPWFDGLLNASDCSVKTPTQDELPSFVWTIVLNIIYDVMLVVGTVAMGFIIYGGYLFIVSEGDTSKAGKAKKTLSAAVIGLIIAVLATLIVNMITGVLLNGS